MKIFYKSKIAKITTFLKNFDTIMLFGAVFTEQSDLPQRVIEHEKIHAFQYKTVFNVSLAACLFIFLASLLIFGFNLPVFVSAILIPIFSYYIWYLTEYFVKLFIYKDHIKAYKSISFEREANNLQYEYLKHSSKKIYPKLFSFIKYIK